MNVTKCAIYNRQDINCSFLHRTLCSVQIKSWRGFYKHISNQLLTVTVILWMTYPNNGEDFFPEISHDPCGPLSHRRQHKEPRCSEGALWLLRQGPLRALSAGGGHHQDPLQEGSQWLVERRSVWPGENLLNIYLQFAKSRNSKQLTCIFHLFPGGAVSCQLCGRRFLWLLLTCSLYVDPVCVCV